MRIRIFSFTNRGRELAETLSRSLEMHEAMIIPKEASRGDVCAAAFRDREALVFIGAAGIAVRSIAPLVRDKLEDPPVLVMDELGRHVIPLLSGHVGGANALALEIAEATGAVPVITTATDINDAFPADLFAAENRLSIADRDGIAKVSSSALEGRPVTLCIKDFPPAGDVDVLVADEREAGSLKSAASIVLCPKRYAAGMGCRRGRTYEELRGFAERVLAENGIELRDVGCIATIDVKKDEEGFRRLSQAWRMPLITFEAGVLEKAEGSFSHSDTVLEKVGVDNVCERAAVLAAGRGSHLVIKKTAENGMTIAVAERT